MSTAESRKTRKRPALRPEAKRASISIWECLEKKRIRGDVIDVEGMSTGSLLDVVPNLPDSTVYSYLKRLEEHGCVTGEYKVIPSQTRLAKPTRQILWKSTGVQPPVEIFGDETASTSCPTLVLLGTWVGGQVAVDKLPVTCSRVFNEEHHARQNRERRWALLSPEERARESADASN